MVILPTGSQAVECAMSDEKYFYNVYLRTPPTRTALGGSDACIIEEDVFPYCGYNAMGLGKTPRLRPTPPRDPSI